MLIQAGQQFHLARKDKVLTLFQLFSSLYNKSGGGQGGGSPGEQGAGGVRETGEERAGSGREIPKGKLSLIVTAHHPVKETNPTKFLDFHLTFSKALNQNFNTRKVKKRKFALRIEKRAILPVKLETFPSRLHYRSRVLMNEVA